MDENLDSLAHGDRRRCDEKHHGSLNFVCVRSALLLFDPSLDGLGDFWEDRYAGAGYMPGK
jgi:hypothetical protein